MYFNFLFFNMQGQLRGSFLNFLLLVLSGSRA